MTRLTEAELAEVERDCQADPDCPWSRIKLSLVAEVRASRAWSLVDHLHRQRAVLRAHVRSRRANARGSRPHPEGARRTN